MNREYGQTRISPVVSSPLTSLFAQSEERTDVVHCMGSGGDAKAPLHEQHGKEDARQYAEDKAVESERVADARDQVIVGQGKKQTADHDRPDRRGSLFAAPPDKQAEDGR